MDLLAIFQVALRRWLILVPALVVSAVACWILASSVSPTYEVDGALKVSYPFASTADQSARLQSNPYYDTAATALVLGQLAKSPDVAAAITAAGGTAKYQIDDSGKAVLTVTVTDPDRRNTLTTYRAIAAQLAKRLDDLQAQKQIPGPFRVTVDDVVQPQDAAVSHSNQLKTALAAGALGLILSLTACVVVELRSRKRPASQPVPESQPSHPPEKENHRGELPVNLLPERPDRVAAPARVAADLSRHGEETTRLRPVTAPAQADQGDGDKTGTGGSLGRRGQ
ncbi:hypothetical protein CU254_01555 [Amycolatopsis sp. AA4]|uniref:hypothetical protein n=1 Tax=Actinomycetes TaxID=1760 RepID=UPI0001B579E1|nr:MULTISPECIES: hypothetical protein [Actinomycetes]ATY09308.1 hypothetical protein CU254_01555 [Amycolatopsis sp. AA4]